MINLQHSLDRLKKNQASEEDISRLGEAINSGKIELEEGSRNVVIVGDVDGADIHTGDTNIQLSEGDFERLLEFLGSLEPASRPGLIDRFLEFWSIKLHPFVINHWRLLLFLILIESALLIAYLEYYQLYIIPSWVYGLSALVILVFLWFDYTRLKLKPTGVVIYITAFILVTGLIGWQIWRIINHPTFETQEFGIAFAQLGEGAGFRRTNNAQEISNQVLESLCRNLRDGVEKGIDPCNAKINPLNGNEIRIIPIGIIKDTATASRFGEQIDADLIIWGQLLTNHNEGGISVRFQILEILDPSINPDFPYVLPLTSDSADFVADLSESFTLDLTETKELVSVQTSVMSSFILGLAAYMQQDFPFTIQQLEKATEMIDENDALIKSKEGLSLLYYYLSRAYHSLGNLEDGQKWLLKAKDITPLEPAIPLSLAFGYRSAGLTNKREEALNQSFQLLNKWLIDHPEDARALYDKGIAFHLKSWSEEGFNRPDVETEIHQYIETLKIDPHFFIAYINLGRAYMTLGQYEEAEKVLSEAVSLAEQKGTNSSIAYLNLAFTRELAGDFEASRNAFQESIKQAIYKAPIYFQYALFLEKIGEIDAALIAYQNFVTEARRQDRGWALAKSADFLRRIGLLNEAISKYREAVFLNTEDPLLPTYLAQAYYEAGDVPNALSWLDTAVDRNESKNIYYVYSVYCQILYQQGEYINAENKCQQSLGARPNGIDELLLLGQIYGSQGKCQEAEESFLKIFDLREQIPLETQEIIEREFDRQMKMCIPSQ